MAVSDSAVLQPGRVIRMRNRLWRVDNVRPPEFTATPIDGRDTQARRFLAEVEDVSEGALPPPDPALASDPAHQDLLLRAFRLTLKARPGSSVTPLVATAPDEARAIGRLVARIELRDPEL
ncbi:MAG: hypothetical protein RIB67_03215 [Miltoncostaeaceae bacterium]